MPYRANQDNQHIGLGGELTAAEELRVQEIQALGDTAEAEALGKESGSVIKKEVGGSYTLPTASADTLGGIKIGTGLSIDENGVVTAGGSMTYPGAGIPLSTGSAWGTSIANNSTNWDTAYGWGNHATAGYLTSLSGAVLTDQSTPQTIGLTGARLAKLWVTDITCTNAIAASITGNAATITVADSTDTTCHVALFEDATGSLAAKTDGGLTYNASTGVLSATGFSGPLTGNVTGNCSGSSGSCIGNSATVTGLSVTAGKTLSVSNSLTITATDGSTLAIGTGGTLGTAAFTASTAYAPALGADDNYVTDAEKTSIGTIGDKEATVNKGAANGYCPLGADSKIASTYMPPIAITKTSVVATEAAQLLLTAEEGDVAVRSDLKKSYIHNGGTAGTMADWTELQTPTDTVLSVNGQTGTVSLNADNIADGTTNKAFTATEKTKLGTIAEGAEVNVQPDWNQATNTADDYIKNKPTLGTAAAEAATAFATSTQGTTADNALPKAGGTMSGDITLGENTAIALDPAGSADEKWSGITCAGTAGATLAVGDLIYLDVTATEWLLADADAASTSGDVPLGICILAANDGQATNILLMGTIRSAAFPASIALGAPVYVSTTAGDIQAAQPTGTDDVIRRVGWAVSAEPNTIYFNPSNDYITHT